MAKTELYRTISSVINSDMALYINTIYWGSQKELKDETDRIKKEIRFCQARLIINGQNEEAKLLENHMRKMEMYYVTKEQVDSFDKLYSPAKFTMNEWEQKIAEKRKKLKVIPADNFGSMGESSIERAMEQECIEDEIKFKNEQAEDFIKDIAEKIVKNKPLSLFSEIILKYYLADKLTEQVIEQIKDESIEFAEQGQNATLEYEMRKQEQEREMAELTHGEDEI